MAELSVVDLKPRCCIPFGSQALKDTRRAFFSNRASLAVVAVEMLLGFPPNSLLAASDGASMERPCCTRGLK